MAMLGLVLGRPAPEETLVSRPPGLVGWRSALAFGAGAVAHASNDDFDHLLQARTSLAQRRQVLERAERAHPVDYFYVQAFARIEPLRPPAGGVSPRLHALNRALRLCPACETVHMEVARSLWQLNLRSQSLVEWREAVRIQPAGFPGALGELFTAGARPEQPAAIAAFDAERMIDVANFLISVGRLTTPSSS